MSASESGAAAAVKSTSGKHAVVEALADRRRRAGRSPSSAQADGETAAMTRLVRR